MRVMEVDVLGAVMRAAVQRVEQSNATVTVRGEGYALSRPLIFDVANALSVSTDAVVTAIEEGVRNGTLRVLRSDETGQLVAVRADPL
jgi:hypothetical protein